MTLATLRNDCTMKTVAVSVGHELLIFVYISSYVVM